MKNETSIELRHLRCFIAVAEELHFDRASERLQVERASLNQTIREIEQAVGVRLISSGAALSGVTRAGAAFLDHARQVMSLMEQASTCARSAALGHSSQVRIGVSDCIAYCRMTEVIARYRALNAEDLVSLHELPLQRQISHIRDDLLDVSVSFDGRPREGICATAVASEVLCAVIPTVHALAQAESLSIADLAHCSLILFSDETDLGAGQAIEGFVETFEQPRIAFRARSLGTMLTLVALGHGIGLLGCSQFAGVARRDVVLRPIRGATPQLKTYMLHASCGLSERVSKLIELAREVLRIDSTAERK